MFERIAAVTVGITLLVIGLASTSADEPKAPKPLVDCSLKRFQSPNSARSLIGWTKGALEDHEKYSKGEDATAVCKSVIDQRGAAYCKEPNNKEYAGLLKDALAKCDEWLAKPEGKDFDCTDKKYLKPKASLELVLDWVDLAVTALDSLRADESPEPKCEAAMLYVGQAHCKAPKDKRVTAARARVEKRCAEVRASRAAAADAAKKAEQKRVADQKANRVITSFPRKTYRGKDAASVSKAMDAALRRATVSKGNDIREIRPMGKWSTGKYRRTKRVFRKLMGTVLWRDTDGDGVCRFTSYNFVSDKKNGKWQPLQFRAFCNGKGCYEGWASCKAKPAAAPKKK